MSDIAKEVSTINIGGKDYDIDSVTPSIYFDYVKSLKKTLDRKEWEIVINTGLIMLEKTKLTGQVAMAERITHEIELCLKELEAANNGFDIFVDRKDIEKYIDAVEGKSIKIMTLSQYSRDIPDDVVEKLMKAKEIFDEIYIIFTDYTLKETKKVAKERRDKDPILFGAFKDDTAGDHKVYVEDRLFFIADWVDEFCDLTLEELVRDVYELDDNNKPVLKKEGSKAYSKLIKYLSDVLDEYTLKDGEGNTIKVNEKRIFLPNFVVVENGKAKDLINGISDNQKEYNQKLTKEIINDEEKLFNKFFKKYNK
jgi:hypothetical protein